MMVVVAPPPGGGKHRRGFGMQARHGVTMSDSAARFIDGWELRHGAESAAMHCTEARALANARLSGKPQERRNHWVERLAALVIPDADGGNVRVSGAFRDRSGERPVPRRRVA